MNIIKAVKNGKQVRVKASAHFYEPGPAAIKAKLLRDGFTLTGKRQKNNASKPT